MNLKEEIEKIPLDKLRHLALGVVYSTFVIMGGVFSTKLAIVGALVGILLAIWKEVWYDWKLKKGNAEFLDFVYNVIPIVLVLMAFLM